MISFGAPKYQIVAFIQLNLYSPRLGPFKFGKDFKMFYISLNLFVPICFDFATISSRAIPLIAGEGWAGLSNIQTGRPSSSFENTFVASTATPL